MTHAEIEAALAAANPLTDRMASALELHDAETELIKRIVATPAGSQPSRPRAWRFGVMAHRRRVVLVLAATAAVVAVFVSVPFGGRDGGPEPAFAAALVRFANSSPLVLLQLPGWHVVYADEEPGGTGQMNFVWGAVGADGAPRGASFRNGASLAGRVASLTWYPINRGSQRYIDAGHASTPTGLGVTVRRFVREGGGRAWLDISAFFVDGHRELDFRATVPDMAMFRAELRALHIVDAATWLRAMPPSVVKTADSGETVRLMLKGIPLPPAFDTAQIRGVRLVHDRYQLGAAVTGTVACSWIAVWNRARTAGDTAMVRRAIAAMATAPRWPILHEMARHGAWPQVLIGYAHAMSRGTWYGRPLTAAVNTGLGCGPQWGISLGP